MNKSLKVISSVAITGMLALNVFNPSVLAKTVNDTINTPLSGIYRNYAQFVLTQSKDYVTFKELKNSSKFTNITSFKGSTTLPNDNELVETGDVFVADGKTYTVVVYGNVDSSEKLTPSDASKIFNHYMGRETLSSEAKIEAANVDRTNNRITPADASQVFEFYMGKTTSLIKGDLPHDEIGDEEDQNFTISFNSPYVNNVNAQASGGLNVKIDLNNLLEASSTSFTIEIDDSNSSTPAVSTALSILNSEITKTVPITNALSGLDNGTLTVKLKDSTGKTVRTTTIEKKAIPVTTLQPKINRQNSLEATFNVEGLGENKITKMYYSVDTTADSSLTITNSTIPVDANNNKISLNINGLTEHTVNYIHYIVEDEYGNRSSLSHGIIALEEAAEATRFAIVKPADLAASAIFTLKTVDANGNATSTDYTPDQNKAIAKVYKNGNVVAEVKNADSTNTEQIDITSIITANGVGEYKISVMVIGNGSVKDSAEVESGSISVSKLASVTGVNIQEGTGANAGKIVVSWNKLSETDITYKIKMYKLNAQGEKVLVDTPITVVTSDAESDIIDNADLTSISSDADFRGYVWYAEVIATKPSQYKLVDSDASMSQNELVLVPSTTLAINSSVPTANSLTLTLDYPHTVVGKATTYDVEVYEKNNNVAVNPYTLLDTKKNLTLNEQGKLVVEGLTSGKTYSLILVEKIGDKQTKTTISDNYITLKTSPVLNGTKVATTYENAKISGSNEIALDGDNLAINGVEYSVTSDASLLGNIAELVSALTAGDKITINNDEITLELASSIKTIDLGDAIASKNVTIICNNKIEKILEVNSSKAPTTLTLSGTQALYDITNANIKAATTTINSGVAKAKIDPAVEVTVKAGANVEINEVNVNPSKDTVIKVDASKNVTITVDENNTTSSDTLNLTNNGNISFKTNKNTNNMSYKAKITSTTPNTVGITTTKVAVDSIINVTATGNANSITIDLEADGLNGNKSITINAGAKPSVKFNQKTALKKAADNTNIVDIATAKAIKLTSKSNELNSTELANWYACGLLKTDGSQAGVDYDAEEITAAIAQLNNLYGDIMNKGATLAIASGVVTITFDGTATTNVTINNIK